MTFCFVHNVLTQMQRHPVNRQILAACLRADDAEFSIVAARWNDATLKCYRGDSCSSSSFGMLTRYHPPLKQGDLSRMSASAGAWGPNYTPSVWK